MEDQEQIQKTWQNEDEYIAIPIVEGEDLEIYDPIYTDLFHIAT